jgi:hypothetical protein
VTNLLVIRGRFSPHKAVFLLWAVGFGVASLATAPPPRSLTATLPYWLIQVWSAGLVVHGAAGLLSLVIPSRWIERALYVELGSMLAGMSATLLAAVSLFAYVGWSAGFAGGLTLAWGVANACRGWMVWRDLHRINEPDAVLLREQLPWTG